VLRVTILHNSNARGPFREGSLVPMNSSISGHVLRKAKSVRIASSRSATILKFMGILTASFFMSALCRKASGRGVIFPS
jgi:hypothetical protein